MKNTKNNNQAVKEAFDNFIDEISLLDKELGACELENVLSEIIGSKLVETELPHGWTVFTALELAVMFSRSELENKNESIESSIRKMDVNAIGWLLDHIYMINEVLKATEKNLSEDKAPLSGLRRHLEELQEWINDNTYNRLQDYQREIKKLRVIELTAGGLS